MTWLYNLLFGPPRRTVHIDPLLGDYADAPTEPQFPGPLSDFDQFRLETELAMPYPWNCPHESSCIGAGDA